MKDRNTAGKLGFIKDSEGVYRKGNFIFQNGKIIRESNIVPEGTIEDVEDNFTTMGECIRSVLSYSTTLGEPPRSTDVYIDKVGKNYKASNKFSKNTVAVVTSQRQVIEIKAKDITEQTDDKALANKDAADKPINPKELKSFSSGKPKNIEERTKEELKESDYAWKTKYYDTEDPNTYIEVTDGKVTANPAGIVLDKEPLGLVKNGDTIYVITSGRDDNTIEAYSMDAGFPYTFKAKDI